MIAAVPRVSDVADGTILRATARLRTYHMSLPLVHGSTLRDGPAPRGADLCNRSSLSAKAAKQQRYSTLQKPPWIPR